MSAPRVVREAAALVIGDELLSGKIRDENIYELARLLRSLGVVLRRVVMVGDDLETISDELRALSARYDLVFTSGGVGPTHDDITVDAVARAFDVAAAVHPELEALLRAAYGARYHAGFERMALAPVGAELFRTEEVPWPTIIMQNVWVLPGVPEVFRMKLRQVASRVEGARQFVTRAVLTRMDEGDLKPLLDEVVARFPEVQVGSYPRWRSEEYKTKITFDAATEAALEEAVAAFLQLLPEGEPQGVV
ncbi:MAG: competence/damage-inducible protein A [Polyangiaceae bacterium]|nr:competence/damage-inducible protein A [Polyangiaceae bacterium]MCW5788959.1 competence/damage-inducible protein A [Polyangiaceae bacterium]